MKNQNDWILSIVFAVLAIGASAYFYFGRREPEVVPKPEPVPMAKLELPQGAVSYAVGLPGGSSSGGAGAAAGPAASPSGGMMSSGRGLAGGPPGMAGPAGAPMGGAPSGGMGRMGGR